MYKEALKKKDLENKQRAIAAEIAKIEKDQIFDKVEKVSKELEGEITGLENKIKIAGEQVKAHIRAKEKYLGVYQFNLVKIFKEEINRKVEMIKLFIIIYKGRSFL